MELANILHFAIDDLDVNSTFDVRSLFVLQMIHNNWIVGIL